VANFVLNPPMRTCRPSCQGQARSRRHSEQYGGLFDQPREDGGELPPHARGFPGWRNCEGERSPVASGTATALVPLVSGANVFSIVVTAPNGVATQTYSVT